MNSSFHCINWKKLAIEMAKFAKFFVENLRTNWSKMATKFRALFYLTNHSYTCCSDKFKHIFPVILISYFECTFHNCFKIVLSSPIDKAEREFHTNILIGMKMKKAFIFCQFNAVGEYSVLPYFSVLIWPGFQLSAPRSCILYLPFGFC